MEACQNLSKTVGDGLVQLSGVAALFGRAKRPSVGCLLKGPPFLWFLLPPHQLMSPKTLIGYFYEFTPSFNLP
jgi:hypothetical protein